MKLRVNGPCGCCKSELPCAFPLVDCSCLRNGEQTFQNYETLPLNVCLQSPCAANPFRYTFGTPSEQASIKLISGTWTQGADGIYTTNGEAILPCVGGVPAIERSGEIVVEVRWLNGSPGNLTIIFGEKLSVSITRDQAACDATYTIQRYEGGQWQHVATRHMRMLQGDRNFAISCVVHSASSSAEISVGDINFGEFLHYVFLWEGGALERLVKVNISTGAPGIVLLSAHTETHYTEHPDDASCFLYGNCFENKMYHYCQWKEDDWIVIPEDAVKQIPPNWSNNCNFDNIYIYVIPVNESDKKTFIWKPQIMAWDGPNIRSQEIEFMFDWPVRYSNVAALFFDDENNALGGFRVEWRIPQILFEYIYAGWCDGDGEWIGEPEQVGDFHECGNLVLSNYLESPLENIGPTLCRARLFLKYNDFRDNFGTVTRVKCKEGFENASRVGLKFWKSREEQRDTTKLFSFFATRCASYPSGCDEYQ